MEQREFATLSVLSSSGTSLHLLWMGAMGINERLSVPSSSGTSLHRMGPLYSAIHPPAFSSLLVGNFTSSPRNVATAGKVSSFSSLLVGNFTSSFSCGICAHGIIDFQFPPRRELHFISSTSSFRLMNCTFQFPPRRELHFIAHVGALRIFPYDLSVPSSSGTSLHPRIDARYYRLSDLSVPSSSGTSLHLPRWCVLPLPAYRFQFPPRRELHFIANPSTVGEWLLSFSSLLVRNFTSSAIQSPKKQKLLTE